MVTQSYFSYTDYILSVIAMSINIKSKEQKSITNNTERINYDGLCYTWGSLGT